MTRLVLLLGLALIAAPAAAQGTIMGAITDKSGAVLPGVEVSVSGPSNAKIVTDAAGLYRFNDLPAGRYTVTATLVGFVTGKRDAVTVVGGQTIRINLVLCLAVLEYIDWVVWRDLAEAWEQSDVVALVRVEATGPLPSECPNSVFLHTTTLLDLFKGNVKGPTLTFAQEHWASERIPYRTGQEMVVLLKMYGDVLWRVSGPYYVFLIDGDKVTSFHSPVTTDDVTRAQFLARLRALAKGARH